MGNALHSLIWGLCKYLSLIVLLQSNSLELDTLSFSRPSQSLQMIASRKHTERKHFNRRLFKKILRGAAFFILVAYIK